MAVQINSACIDKFTAIKTNMSKAYDIIEWDFLEAVMAWLGFGRTLIS